MPSNEFVTCPELMKGSGSEMIGQSVEIIRPKKTGGWADPIRAILVRTEIALNGVKIAFKIGDNLFSPGAFAERTIVRLTAG